MSALVRVLVCLCCFACLPAYAGSFKVFPLKLSFDSENKTALFRITNTGDASVTVQLEGAAWSQVEPTGEDHYESTRDIIIFPKIVEVAKGEERVVRVAYRGNPVTTQERTYRLFAQELPKKSEADGALSFALRFSVPVFVTSRAIRPDVRVLGGRVEDGKAKVIVKNRGTKHVIVSSIKIAGFSPSKELLYQEQVKGWYVLPNSTKIFSIPLDLAQCRDSRWITGEIEARRKAHDFQFDVDTTQCVAPQKDE